MSRTDLDTWEENQAKKRPRKKDGDSQQGIDFVTKLGAAKHSLALAQEIPEFTDLIDNADAVRAAAKAMHISATGINAWMRFVVDAERKAWARIETMREAGELAKQSQPKTRHAKVVHKELLRLQDIIDYRWPAHRASEWAALSRLTEFQLDEMERIANEEDRLLSRAELFRLAKAGTPEPSDKPEKIRSPEDLEVIARAQDIASSEGFVGEVIRVGDDAKVNRAEKGWWVEAWVFIEDELTRSDIDQP